jgi:hypothetical protein
MNKALLIANNSESVSNLKAVVEKGASCVLTLSTDGNYRPTKFNIEKALLWLRCSKCDSLGLLRCGHGFNHSKGTSLYLVVNLPSQEGSILTSDNKLVSQDYIYSNLFYALPEGIRLSSVINMTVDSLEFKLEKTPNGTFKITKQNNIPLKADINVLSTDKFNDVDFTGNVLSVLEFSQHLSFSGSFCINNAFLES